MVLDDHRRVRREVLLIERRDLVLPDLLAGLRVEAHHPVVVQLEIDVVAPHPETARLQARAAPRLPVVLPQHRAVARVDRVDVARRRRVDDAVDGQDAAAEARRSAVVGVAVAQAADVDRRGRAAAATAPAAKSAATRRHRRTARRTASGRQAADPLEAEILDGIRVDQFELAESLAAHVTGVAGPLIRQRLPDDVHRIEAADLGVGRRGRGLQRLALPVRMSGCAGAAILAAALREHERRAGGERQDEEDMLLHVLHACIGACAST